MESTYVEQIKCLIEVWNFFEYQNIDSQLKMNCSFPSKYISHQPISGQCSISIPPENVRKPLVLWHFQGVKERNIGMRWVKNKQFTKKVVKQYFKYFALDLFSGKLCQPPFRSIEQRLDSKCFGNVFGNLFIVCEWHRNMLSCYERYSFLVA